MTRRVGTFLLLAGIALGSGSSARGEPAKPVKWANGAPATRPVGTLADDTAVILKLSATPLLAPELVLSKSDALPKLRMYNGIVLPKASVQFTRDKNQVELALADAKFTLGYAAGQYTLRGPDGKTTTLQRSDTSLRPVNVQLDKDHRYTLAFPYVMGGTAAAMLTYRSGFVMRGSIGDQTVLLYDDNTDGRFTLGHDGYRVSGLVGGCMVFAPLGRYISTPSALLEITRLSGDGTELEYRPAGGETGKLAIGFNAAESELQACFTSAANHLSMVAATRGGSSNDFVVLPGDYQMSYGVVYSPALKKVVATVVTSSVNPVSISAAGDQKAQLGGPFSLDFKATLTKDKKVNIKPTSIRLRGKGGEEYTEISYVTAALPEVSLVVGKVSTPLGKMAFG